MSYRPVFSSDLVPITAALEKLKAYASKYEWAVAIDFSKAVYTILAEAMNDKGFIVDGYLVMIDIIKPWYSNQEIMQEWLVLKVYDGGSVDSVPVSLRTIAKHHGCKVIITADSSPVQLVAEAYNKAGYLPLTQSFYTKV